MVTAIVMVGGIAEESRPISWVEGARIAATQDLLEQLCRQPLLERIILVSPHASTLAIGQVVPVVSPVGTVHVGNYLGQLIKEWDIQRLLYMGGGAAPLLDDATLTNQIEHLARMDRVVVTNNRFASDWAGVVPASTLLDHIPQLPRDNMLGWVLSTAGSLPAHTPPLSAGTRLDIDTPTDLLVLRLSPRTKPHLRNYLAQLPLDTQPLQKAVEILATPAKRLFVAGRIAPEIWQTINQVSRCWVRVLAEERGMESSGRVARGEVFSLLAQQIELLGMGRFFQQLDEWADAAFLDSRVLWAHWRQSPTAHDRFAADLGWVEQIQDVRVKELAIASQNAKIPVILGGHSLLTGDMLVLCELVASL